MVVESNERILKSVLTLFKCFLFFCGFDFLYVLLNEFQMPFFECYYSQTRSMLHFSIFELILNA